MKTIVLSLGGSLIAPDKVDAQFLKNFKKTVDKFVRKGFRFVIICGGGKIARNYQEAASKIIKTDNNTLDWIGIYATILNANFVKELFGNTAHSEIITNPTKKISSKKKIIVASGWKPGWSTDYDAVLLAKQLKSDMIVNMSNVDYVYDKDPKKFKSAKKINNTCWKHFRELIGSKWTAGLNAPFDPIAAREAQKSKKKVMIIGKNLKNFENLISGKKFKGTLVENC
ncbi:UMP kinase [Candidatus Woesearchaeota archaeon]|nr:UMP kinase [Candidatus Woesearchaeota archaeon]